MMETCNIIVIVCSFIALVIMFYTKFRKKDNPKNKYKEIICNTELMCGEVKAIVFDSETGLSKIIMKEDNNKSLYGYSSISVDELKRLYLDKGYVQIPLVDKKH